jgi:hypothetical protein
MDSTSEKWVITQSHVEISIGAVKRIIIIISGIIPLIKPIIWLRCTIRIG